MKMEMQQRGPGRPKKEIRKDQIRLYISHEVYKAWEIYCIQREIEKPDALEEALVDQMKKKEKGL